MGGQGTEKLNIVNIYMSYRIINSLVYLNSDFIIICFIAEASKSATTSSATTSSVS